jgi:hypothetical protein
MFLLTAQDRTVDLGEPIEFDSLMHYYAKPTQHHHTTIDVMLEMDQVTLEYETDKPVRHLRRLHREGTGSTLHTRSYESNAKNSLWTDEVLAMFPEQEGLFASISTSIDVIVQAKIICEAKAPVQLSGAITLSHAVALIDANVANSSRGRLPSRACLALLADIQKATTEQLGVEAVLEDSSIKIEGVNGSLGTSVPADQYQFQVSWEDVKTLHVTAALAITEHVITQIISSSSVADVKAWVQGLDVNDKEKIADAVERERIDGASLFSFINAPQGPTLTIQQALSLPYGTAYHLCQAIKAIQLVNS